MQRPDSKEADAQQGEADGYQSPLPATPGHPPGDTQENGGDDCLDKHSEVGSGEQEFEHLATVSGRQSCGVPLRHLEGRSSKTF